jgi:uncharacterized ion transporter superfamily protein YfcC
MPNGLFPTDGSSDGHDGDALCRADGDETVRAIMAKGYAAVMIILALGFVAFVLGISTLAFFYPEKAQSFLTLYAIPVGALLGLYGVKAQNAWRAQIEKKKL